MTKQDPYKALIDTIGNPTKLSIIFLLSHNQKMTVTQMAKHVGVGKANLYHFVSQMVSDGLLTKPEAVVKENYVEKYYRLNQELFKAVDPDEQRKRLKGASPEKLKTILQSALVSVGLDFRLLAEEIGRADRTVLLQIAKSVAEERVTLSYAILSEEPYQYFLSEVKKINRTINEKWGHESPTRGNRVVIVGIPQLTEEPQG